MGLWDRFTKAFTRPEPYSRALNALHYNDRFNVAGRYRSEDAENNSVVKSAVHWLARALESTPLRLYSDPEFTREVEQHEILNLLDHPNGFHSKSDLLYGIINSLIVNGNAYIQLLQPDGIQSLPYQWIYDVLPGRASQPIMYRIITYSQTNLLMENEVCHIVWTISPDNAYVGQSPLESAYPFILLDRFAAEAASGRLQSPIPGLIVKPSAKEPKPLSSAEKTDLRNVADTSRGAGAGSTWTLEGGAEVIQLTDNLHRFDFTELHQMCEARISAPIGVPPSISQLSIGLAQSRIGAVMNVEARIAWLNAAIPLAHKIASGLNRNLLPKLGYDGLYLAWDFSGIDFEVEDDKAARSTRIINEVAAGLRTPESAMEELGIEVE